MVDWKAVTNLATVGLAAYIATQVLPSIKNMFGGLGGGQVLIEGTPPLTAEQTQQIFRSELANLEAVRAEVAREIVPQIAAASVVPGSPIGVGQQEFAVPDIGAQIAALQDQIAQVLAGQTSTILPIFNPLGIGETPPVSTSVPYVSPSGVDYSQPSQFVSEGQASVPVQYATNLSGTYWVDPYTNQPKEPYVSGVTPAWVLAARIEGKYPALRGF